MPDKLKKNDMIEGSCDPMNSPKARGERARMARGLANLTINDMCESGLLK